MAPTNGYCDTATVKTTLNIGDSSHDTRLDQIITAVSRAIDDKCERRFYAASETRYYTAGHWYWLPIADDLLSVSALATDQTGSRAYDTVWAAGDYDLYPYNAALDGYPYGGIMVNRLSGHFAFPQNLPRGVKVTGSFGYAAATPDVVREACILQTVRLYKRVDLPFGVAGSGEFGQANIGSIRLDPDVADLLFKIRRVRIA